jgi:F-type H+-transporting ATPase subunit b
MELLKLLSANEIVAQVISFLLLLFILRKFLWNKFTKVLDDRRDRVASELLKIEDAKADVERIKADYNVKLDGIEKAAKEKMEEAIAEGRRISEELRQGAERDGQKMIDSAKLAIEGEISKAKDQLKDDIVDITIGIAEKVIEEKLTEGADKRIVEEFIKRIDRA